LIDAELANRGANRDRLLQEYLNHAFLDLDSNTSPAMIALKSKCMETLTRVLALERKQDGGGRSNAAVHGNVADPVRSVNQALSHY